MVHDFAQPDHDISLFLYNRQHGSQ